MTDAVPVVYLDSNVFIYLLEGTPDLREMLDAFFRALGKNPGRAITSELTLGEVLAPSKQPGAWSIEEKYRAYPDLIVRSGTRLEPVSRSIIYMTPALRLQTGLKLIDSIHVATAVDTQCRYFFTADRRLAMPANLAKVLPDGPGVARVLEALH